jgi:cytochrome c oxidase subunit 2
MKKWSAVLLLVLALAFAACGGDDADESTDTTAAAGGSGGSVSLTAKDFEFSPQDLSISAGDSIELTNDGGAEHNFSIDGEGIDVDAEAGASATVDTSGLAAGTYDYFCKYHSGQGMTGTLEVK